MVFVMGSKSTTLLLLEWIKARKEHFSEDTITPSRGKELQHRGINKKEACDIVCQYFEDPVCCVTVLVVLVFWQSARKIRQSDTQVFGGVTRRRNSYVCGTFGVLLVFITVVVAERGAPSDCAGLYTSCKKESFVLHRRKWIAGTKRRK